MHLHASNNIAEYEVLILSMRISIALGIWWICVLDDSMLVINQIYKEWMGNVDKMMTYCQEIYKLEDKFDGIEFLHMVRTKNEEVGVLEKLVSSRPLVPSRVFLQILHGPTIHEKMASPLVKSLYGSDSEFPITQLAEVMVINSDWHTPFIQYSRIGLCHQIKHRRSVSNARPKLMHWLMMKYTGRVP